MMANPLERFIYLLWEKTGRFPDEILKGTSPRQLNKLMAHYSLKHDEAVLVRLEQENQNQLAVNRKRWESVR